MNYIKWDINKLKEFLSTQEMRNVDIAEYELLIKFINKIKPDTIIDVGTYLGHSGYILGTCCDSIKNIISIENIHSQEYFPKEEASPEEHGKYLPKEAVFLTDGYEKGIFDDLIKKYPNSFIFWDAGKNSIKVMRQIQLSYKNKVKYIAFHDSGKIQRTVRRAIMRAEKLGLYQIIDENIDSCPKKGVSILMFNIGTEDAFK